MNNQKRDALENAGSKPLSNFSNFAETLPFRFANTFRFGEVGVHYLADVVPSENGRFINSHKLRSYTMPNPLLQSLKMRKTYGFIPTSAVLPLNYEKYITIPNRGEDVNAKLVGCSVEGFIGLVTESLYNLALRADADFAVSDVDSPSFYTNAMRFVIMYDMFFSNGSLLKSMGATIAPKDSTPDADVDSFWNEISQLSSDDSYIFRLTIRDKSWYVGSISPNSAIGTISLREAISRMRDDLSFTVLINPSLEGDIPGTDNFLNWSAIQGQSTDATPFDVEPFFAYQLFCSHFFSNDHVDSIFTAELWRQNLYSLILSINPDFADAYFLWNGVRYRYDTCSAYAMQSVFSIGLTDLSDISLSLVGSWCDYFRLIFGYNRSLRYGDYFTGSRTVPLAPGDVNVTVNGDSFSVVENIQKSWIARLYAQVQRVGRRIGEQTKALFKDTAVVQDWHEPIWLGETVSDVFPEEVDNTGQDMYDTDKPISSISVLHSEQEALAFDLRVPDRYGVVIGFTWFDIARFYSHSTLRRYFHVTRFDKFNPYLQFNGDQPIFLKELSPDSRDLDEVFAYTGRYMEYKNNYNRCAGGFVDETLPGLIFKADVEKDKVDIAHLSSDYIRSYPSELDRFYLSLSGWSLGHYFHFLVINTNMYDGNKPMAYNPTLD